MNLINSNKPVAILGGMGPDASVKLCQMMISMAREEYGAIANHEYPEIILQSVPDFISDTNNVNQTILMLKNRIKKLNKLSISCVALACNTAHLVLPELKQIADINFISLIDEIVAYLLQKNYKQVALLGSPTTIYSGLYQQKLYQAGIKTLLPNHQQIEILDQCIHDIVAGRFKPPKAKLLKIADSLKKQKAQAIILGCTELPLVFPQNYSLPIIDSLKILSRVLLKKYYQKEAL